MSLEDNKRIALRTANELVSQGKLELCQEVIHPDYTYTGPAGLTARGPDGYRAFVGLLLGAFSGLTSDIGNVIAEGDWVSMSFRVTATNDGAFLGHPPTGNQVDFRGIIACRIAEGKVIEQFEMFDYMTLLQQLGLADVAEPMAFA